ncbi:hypothetical protein K7X08_019286 [Anisodus acutangulus]|uniref:Uncharacterized protein n=1 Tax=Anisodus acutangulus TaxID=402998 RepID=A0A9Q1MUY1_9SOLA|nr:hypothetical protein K7X08_019286 [Anisodus acutangulus]
MGRSTFIVAVFLMLFFSLSHGIGRKTIGSFSHGHTHRISFQEKSSETYELDYIDAGPNFNAHGGIPVSPPHQPTTPTQD